MPAAAGFRDEALLDFDNSGQCYQTGNRFYLNSHSLIQGFSTLTSPSINLRGADALVHLAIYYQNNYDNASHTWAPHEDTLFVSVRGGPAMPWRTAIAVGPVYRADGGWFEYTFRVGDFVTPSSNVSVMVTAKDGNNLSSIEAVVDDFWVARFECDSNTWCCLDATGNVDCDPSDGADISDLSGLIDFLYITFTPLCCPKEANVDGDPAGGIDISDLSALIDYLYISFTPPAACK